MIRFAHLQSLSGHSHQTSEASYVTSSQSWVVRRPIFFNSLPPVFSFPSFFYLDIFFGREVKVGGVVSSSAAILAFPGVGVEVLVVGEVGF